jgi:hypothetical protein
MAREAHPLSRPDTAWLVHSVMIVLSAALIGGFLAAAARGTVTPDPTGVMQLREALHVQVANHQHAVRLGQRRERSSEASTEQANASAVRPAGL